MYVPLQQCGAEMKMFNRHFILWGMRQKGDMTLNCTLVFSSETYKIGE
jgi:hypothetical protein